MPAHACAIKCSKHLVLRTYSKLGIADTSRLMFFNSLCFSSATSPNFSLGSRAKAQGPAKAVEAPMEPWLNHSVPSVISLVAIFNLSEEQVDWIWNPQNSPSRVWTRRSALGKLDLNWKLWKLCPKAQSYDLREKGAYLSLFNALIKSKKARLSFFKRNEQNCNNSTVALLPTA